MAASRLPARGAPTHLQNVAGRVEGSDTRTTNALNKAISPADSLPTTVDDLAAIRSRDAAPAYQAAGVPERPEMRVRAIDEPPTPNSPIVSTPALEKLYAQSSIIRQAINGIRTELPDYKDIPYNSMTMWDQAYKRLGDAEQAARQAGKNSRANDLQNFGKTFLRR